MSVLNNILSSGNNVNKGGKTKWTKEQMVAAIGLKTQGFNNEDIGNVVGHPKGSVAYLFGVKLKDAEKKYPTQEAFYAYLGVTSAQDFETAANAVKSKVA
jgi:hypothetical protein